MLKTIFSNKDLRNKTILTIVLLTVMQFLTNIPIPTVNEELFRIYINSDAGHMMNFLSLFSGNAFNNMSMFVLGISPFISASIVMQLLKSAIPSLEELSKAGRRGQELYKKLTYATGMIFSFIQSIPVANSFRKNGIIKENTAWFFFLTILMLSIGSIIFILIGYTIEKHGIGNGTSMILFINIVSRMPNDFKVIYNKYIINSSTKKILLVCFLTLLILTLSFVYVIYLQKGEKRIPVQYSSKLNGERYDQNKNYIPLKVNIGNIMPVIFVSNVIQLFNLAVDRNNVNSFWTKLSKLLDNDYWFRKDVPQFTWGILLYALLIVGFQYLYSTIIFDTEKITENLQKSDGVISGIRSGADTKRYLDRKLSSVCIVGSIGLIIIAIVPNIILALTNLREITLGGASLLILASVAVETYRKFKSECLGTETESSFLE